MQRNEHPWSRAHSSASDSDTQAQCETIAARYRAAPQWARFNIRVHKAFSGKFYVACQLKSIAELEGN